MNAQSEQTIPILNGTMEQTLSCKIKSLFERASTTFSIANKKLHKLISVLSRINAEVDLFTLEGEDFVEWGPL